MRRGMKSGWAHSCSELVFTTSLNSPVHGVPTEYAFSCKFMIASLSLHSDVSKRLLYFLIKNYTHVYFWQMWSSSHLGATISQSFKARKRGAKFIVSLSFAIFITPHILWVFYIQYNPQLWWHLNIYYFSIPQFSPLFSLLLDLHHCYPTPGYHQLFLDYILCCDPRWSFYFHSSFTLPSLPFPLYEHVCAHICVKTGGGLRVLLILLSNLSLRVRAKVKVRLLISFPVLSHMACYHFIFLDSLILVFCYNPLYHLPFNYSTCLLYNSHSFANY